MLGNLLSQISGDGSYWAGQYRSPDKLYFDNWGEPFLYALIGFLLVFVGITLIIFIVWLLGLIMRKTNNLEFLTKKREKTDKKQAETTQNSQSELKAESDDIPDEVKVAIMAAIMAYYEEKQEKCQFTVKRIKRL